MIVAIDGPAAAGKGTLSRLLAKEMNLAWLETGSLYRAVALRVLRDGSDPGDSRAAVAVAGHLDAGDLNDPELRREDVGQVASRVAAIPEVRAALIGFQRRFARRPPGRVRGAVLDGRDVGTVVCPDADHKVFVTATPEARARRRFLQLREGGDPVDERQVLAATIERDRRDTERGASPLVPAEDAYLLDTTNLSIDAAFTTLTAYISGSNDRGPRGVRGPARAMGYTRATGQGTE